MDNIRKISLLSIALVLSMFFIASCDDDEDPIDQPVGSDQVDSTDTVKEIQTDGVNTFSDREIDSLRFTYEAEPTNGLYFVPKASRISIDLLPMKMWEKLTSRDIAWTDPSEKNYNWHLYHRTDWIKISTGGKPMTIAQADSGFVLTIPLDGNCSSGLQALLEKRDDGLYTILINGKGTSFHPQGAGLRSDAIEVFHKDRTPLETLKKDLTP